MMIDAHCHTWGENTDELPWVGGLPPEHTYSDKPYTHQQHVSNMEELGIDKSVIVSIGTMLYEQSRANEYMMRSLEAHPDRLFGASVVNCYDDEGNVLEEDALRKNTARAIGHNRLLGVRLLSIAPDNDITQGVDPENEWNTDDRLNPLFDVVSEVGKCVYIFPSYEQLPLVSEVASNHPNLDIVVDHMAWPDEDASPDEKPWATFRDLSDYESVHVKISSLAEYSEDGWPYQDLYPYIQNLLDWFGRERLIFGSDYPYNDPWGSYEELVTWFDEADFLSNQDKEWLTHRSFTDLHGM